MESEQLEQQFESRLTGLQTDEPLNFVGSILLIAEASPSIDAGEYRAQFVSPTAGAASPRSRSPARPSGASSATASRERSPSQPDLQLSARVLLESSVSHLDVSAGQLLIDVALGDQTISWGAPIELLCHVRPRPLAPDTVAVWIKDSVPIEVSARPNKFRCALYSTSLYSAYSEM